MPPRPRRTPQTEHVLRNDGSHGELEAAADAVGDLFDSPAYLLGASNPAVLEKLGELDDVVFEAIAGRTAAVERLPKLWAEALATIGPELAEESRQAYLQHAVAKWHECAAADACRNPLVAVTLMDVMAILLA